MYIANLRSFLTGSSTRTLALSAAILVSGGLVSAAGPPPLLPISQVPLTISLPANPQIVFAVANSESMDGSLSGAILAGAGSHSASFAQLNASS
jgi:type IV pilus assembly protein PilY1